MRKSAKKRAKSQELPAPRQQTRQLAEFVRRNLMSFIVHEGMKALDELLEQEQTQLCGPAEFEAQGRHQTSRHFHV